jgi:hypothetical protein
MSFARAAFTAEQSEELIVRIGRLACCFVFAISVPVTSVAHESHKGTSVAGSIMTVAGDRVTLEVEGRALEVTLGAKTKIFVGNREADRAALEPGSHAVAYGNKLPGGGLAAQEIVVGGTQTGSSHHRGVQ